MYYQKTYDGIAGLAVDDGFQATISVSDGGIIVSADMADKEEADKLIDEFNDNTGLKKLQEGSVMRKYKEFHVLEARRLNNGYSYPAEARNMQDNKDNVDGSHLPKVHTDDTL